jgi:hypothetical protein
MAETGAISQEEFAQVRSLLGDQLRHASDPDKKRPRPENAAAGPDTNDDFLGIWKGCIAKITAQRLNPSSKA